ncbi:MAG TPA: type IV toxin-antitoxin system AbiEi family antitoxin [Terriglobia bacterium]|nr:type IV toxin-antitoxin system AbiEi family antitoxin [Terriglobia bacterium]
MDLEKLKPFKEQLQAVPFIREVRLSKPEVSSPHSLDGIATVKASGERFDLAIVVKHSYLDRSSTNALLATAEWVRKERGQEVLLFARYIPRPTGERLVDGGINFVDLVGNMNLVLGRDYRRTILGRQEIKKSHQVKRATPAQVKFLFTLAAHPESAAWPVRQLAAVAGISKSQAAEVRQALLETGVIVEKAERFQFPTAEQQKDQLLLGYSQVLRPKLLVNRFRSPDRDPQDFIKRLRPILGDKIHYSLTGGPASELLQHFYRGIETPIFLVETTPALLSQLRLLPDKAGPVILLHFFGGLALWKSVKGVPIAHPWLIYAELMHSDDPRAHEAAEELWEEFLAG